MKNKSIKDLLKATIFWIIVAFLIVVVICTISIKWGKEKFLMATNILDMITVKTNANTQKSASELKTFEKEGVTVLMNCPSYGQNYATLKIPSIDIELPIYYGTTLDLLKNGIGHEIDSYFPGEGGSIILMGHNYKQLLAKLPNTKIGDSIQIATEYGEFEYTIYHSQVVKETETNKVPIQEDGEILMIYTCWPINNIGYTTERYVVYAK